jgi:3-hydroxyacyl-CoA dehydrogenase
VRGAKTSKEVIATSMDLGKTIGKVSVLAGVCFGFIANRVMSKRSLAANELVLRGPTPQQIDKALFDYGFAMGPFAMTDLVGLDVIGRGSGERTLNGDLVALERLGQKKNGGYYDYDEKRKASPSPVAAKVIEDFAAYKGIQRGLTLSDEEIVGRLLFPVVNEGVKLLEEGIALRASDIDVALILGYNWPAFTGGPMHWADSVGLQKVVDSLRAMGIEPAKTLVGGRSRGCARSKEPGCGWACRRRAHPVGERFDNPGTGRQLRVRKPQLRFSAGAPPYRSRKKHRRCSHCGAGKRRHQHR